MRLLKLVALSMCLLAILSSSCLSVQILGGRTYTLDAHWNEGVMNRVTHDPIHDQLQLIPPSQVDMGFIWTPNNDSTISRVDVDSGLEVGRYKVGPDGWGASPSRTTVDQDGNCWVGCRNLGTVVKVGVEANGQGIGWIDRNSNGICDTCVDSNSDGVITGTEILPFGDDECVLFEVLLSDDQYRGTYAPNNVKDQWGYYVYCGSGPRGLAVDGQNNLWAGTYGTRKYFYIRGDNGQIQQVVDFAALLPPGMDHTPYGAVLDSNGVLWSSGSGTQTIMKLDPRQNPVTCTFRNLNHFVYGLGMDSNGHLFIAGWSNSCITRINVNAPGIGVEWTRPIPNLYIARGVCCTADGDVWVAVSGTGCVVRLNNDCTIVEAEIYVGGEPTGVAVDDDGYVWVVGNGDSAIHQIDPATNTVVMTVDLVDTYGHYGYSDMTGLVAEMINVKKGTWTAVYDSAVVGAAWGVVDWNCLKPAGTDVKFRVCSSEDNVNWSNWENAVDGATLTQVPDGRYLKIEASLETTTDGVTPILYDVTVSYVNGFVVVPTSLTVPEEGQNTFQVKLKAAPTTTLYAYTSRISGDADLYVKAGGSLTFTTANWNTFQTVTLGAQEDPDLANGSATFRVSNAALRSRDVFASEIDNDSMPYQGKWGTYGSAPGSFDHPMDVACDAQGYVYVADTQNHRIQKFTPVGQFVLQWGSYGTGEGQFDQPCGISVGRAGHIFVADTYNNRIQEFLPDGTYFGGIEYINMPWGISFDADGRLFALDTYYGQIRRYVWYDYGDGTGYWYNDANWGYQGIGDGQFRYPEGIALDANGNMYVADTYNNRIQVLNSAGNFAAKWGSFGTAAGQFRYPKGVCFDPSYSNLLVSDTYNNRIQAFYGSTFISQWGSYGTGDGQFACPGGIAFDQVGNLYVADTDNNRIQRFGWTLGHFRGYPSGSPVAFGPVAVTAVFPSMGCIYVESLDRVAGIRVNTTDTFTVGQLVDVKGTIIIDTTAREQYVQPTAGWPKVVGDNYIVEPLGMRNGWLYETANSTSAAGWPYYSAGVLTQTWGRVIAWSNSGYFAITDGSGTHTYDDYYWQWINYPNIIDVYLPPGITAPDCGTFVKIVGISSNSSSGHVSFRPRSIADLTIVDTWDNTCVPSMPVGQNYISLPGIPRYSYIESVWRGCAGTPGLPIEGYVSRYYVPTQSWMTFQFCPPTPIHGLIGEGYGLQILPGWSDSYQYERTPVTGDQVISLPMGSANSSVFSLIGNPFNANVPWSSISVADTRELKTLAQAISMGWIHSIQKWNGSTWQTVNVSTESMEARKAYKVFPNRNKIALIVPEP